MATNYVQTGKVLFLAPSGGASAGDPVKVGSISGVALFDIASGAGGSVAVQEVFALSVKAVNDGGNSAVAIGDPLYIIVEDTPKISKKSSGKFFGYALEAIGSGLTATISVLLVGQPGPGTSEILTEGVITGAMLAENIAISAPDLTFGAAAHNYAGAHAAWALSAAEMKAMVLTATNADGAVDAVATPTAGKVYIITNTSGQILTFKATGQTGVAIASTKTAIVRGNGTDFIRVTADA
jgi:predicted RecA/RadA family phage recombinase